MGSRADIWRPHAPGTLIAVCELAAVMLVGAMFRLGLALASSIPLHDGGMFLSTIQDVRATWPNLPDVLSYNHAGIPFDYPPLAFIAAAVLPVDPLTFVHFVGPIFAMATIPALYLIALEIPSCRPYALLVALLYAVDPRGWDWLVAGGSMTRTPGLFFAMLAIWQVLVMYRTLRWRNAFAAGVLGGLSALTHPEAAEFFAVAFFLIAAVRLRDRTTLGRVVLAAGASLAIVAPWLLYLASRGRLLDLVGAGSQGVNVTSSILAVLSWTFADEQMAQVIVALGLLGALRMAWRRDYFVPLWLLADVLIAVRAAPTYASFPLCLAAAVGLYEGIGRGVLRIRREHLLQSGVLRGILVLAIFWSCGNTLLLAADRDPPFDSLPPSAVSTMTWLASNTPSDAQFAVVSGSRWYNDVYGEWLPALSGRRSMATIQGLEWRGTKAWDGGLAAYEDLQKCAEHDANCVAVWMRKNGDTGPAYAYVVNSPDSSALMSSVESSALFEVIRSGDDGVVARLLPAGK